MYAGAGGGASGAGGGVGAGADGGASGAAGGGSATASPMGGSSSGSPTAARISSMIMIFVRLCLPPEAGDTGRPVRRMAGAMVSRKPMEGAKAATVARISWYSTHPRLRNRLLETPALDLAEFRS